jgi:8-oxo-dGTP diphosphatase
MFSTRDFAVAILLDTSSHLLLQLRDNIPNILYPGKIGLFGGHREEDENFLECIVREVHEELSYYIPPECFERASHRTEADPNVPGGNMHIEIFLARDIPLKQLMVTEGRLKVVALSMSIDLVKDFRPRLSSLSRLSSVGSCKNSISITRTPTSSCGSPTCMF